MEFEENNGELCATILIDEKLLLKSLNKMFCDFDSISVTFDDCFLYLSGELNTVENQLELFQTMEYIIEFLSIDVHKQGVKVNYQTIFHKKHLESFIRRVQTNDPITIKFFTDKFIIESKVGNAGEMSIIIKI